MKNKKLFLCVISGLFLFVIFFHSVRAQSVSCSASVSPSSVGANISSILNFSVSNESGSSDIKWIKFLAPSQDFEINSGNAGGWAASLSSPTELIFKNGTLNAGGSASFNISTQTGVNNVPPAQWQVSVSSESGGTGEIVCSGDTKVSIVGPGDVFDGPVISGISVSEITENSVVVSWTTNKDATSYVEYGKTDSYGENKSDVIFTQQHRIIINGLTPDTGYHFRIESKDSDNNIGRTSDNTFTTAKKETVATPEPTPPPSPSDNDDDSGETGSRESGSSSIKETPKPKKKVQLEQTVVQNQNAAPIADTISPVVVILTDLSIPYEKTPQVKGYAKDASGIKKIEYSIDGGRNWSPIGYAISFVGNFVFTPPVVSDDSYELVVRAYDNNGNVGNARAKLIIDRYPPLLGPALVSYGPMILKPDQNMVFTSIAGADLKVTFSTSGGPEKIRLIAHNETEEQVFSLVKNIDTGLWSGIVSFSTPGLYKVIAESLDGAGRKEEKTVLFFSVLEKGSVSDNKSNVVTSGELTIFSFDEITKRYLEWDASAFGIQNPIKLSNEGRFSIILPAGKYFFQLNSKDFTKGRTKIFINKDTRPVSGRLVIEQNLKSNFRFLRGVISQFLPIKMKMIFNESSVQKNQSGNWPDLKNTKAPSLESVDSNLLSFFSDAAGKPKVLTFLSTWSPESSDQMKIFSDLGDSAQNIMVVFAQDTTEEAEVFKHRGNYTVNVSGDPFGIFMESYNLRILPFTVFIDGDGIIRETRIGVISKEEIINAKKSLNDKLLIR